MQDIFIIYEVGKGGAAVEWNPKYYTIEALGS